MQRLRHGMECWRRARAGRPAAARLQNGRPQF
jgi:hypothetical protein